MKNILIGFCLFISAQTITAQTNQLRPYDEIRIYSNNTIQMTDLIRDTLLFRQDTIMIDDSPLLQIEGLSANLFHEGEALSEEIKKGAYIRGLSIHFCDRGYIARWEIKKDRLYLKEIHPKAIASQPDLTAETLRKRVEQITGQTFGKSGQIPARWFTGTLKGGIGGKLNPYGIAGDFKKQIAIRIEKGKMTGFTITEIEKKDDGSFEYRLPADNPAEQQLPYNRYRFYPSGWVTTNLTRDKLEYQSDTIEINESPLLTLNGLILPNRHDPRFAPDPEKPTAPTPIRIGHTDRGYTARWQIDGRKLYLEKIELQTSYTDTTAATREQPFLDHIQQQSGETWSDGRLFAGWFTGRIVGGIDGKLKYPCTGNFQKQAVITVENGIVQKVEITPVDPSESGLFEYRLPGEDRP